MLQQIIDLNPVEPVRIGFRQARGAKFSCQFLFRLPEAASPPGALPQASPVESNPQLVFRPRSRGGAYGYDIVITDAVNGIGMLEVDGVMFNDPAGYTVELYLRDAEGRPTAMIAQGVMALTGAAYAFEGPLGPASLPTGPSGPAGPIGPAGQDGADSTVPGPEGQRGSQWFTGEGPPPGGTVNYVEGDMWLDTLTGDIWRYDASVGTWTRAP